MNFSELRARSDLLHSCLQILLGFHPPAKFDTHPSAWPPPLSRCDIFLVWEGKNVVKREGLMRYWRGRKERDHEGTDMGGDEG